MLPKRGMMARLLNPQANSTMTLVIDELTYSTKPLLVAHARILPPAERFFDRADRRHDWRAQAIEGARELLGAYLLVAKR